MTTPSLSGESNFLTRISLLPPSRFFPRVTLDDFRVTRASPRLRSPRSLLSNLRVSCSLSLAMRSITRCWAGHGWNLFQRPDGEPISTAASFAINLMKTGNLCWAVGCNFSVVFERNVGESGSLYKNAGMLVFHFLTHIVPLIRVFPHPMLFRRGWSIDQSSRWSVNWCTCNCALI